MSTEGNIINAFLDDEVITNYKYRWDTAGGLLFWTLNVAFLSDDLMQLKKNMPNHYPEHKF